MRNIIVLTLLLLFTLSAYAQTEYQTPQELADPNGNFVIVNGVSIYYVTHGDVDNPAVILIHGFGGSTFTWRDNMSAIADAGYYVIALDLPPFGLSDKRADIGYTHRDFADYVAGLMDELNIETATIVGHSMGGSVTAYFAVEYPERINSLIFVDGGIFEARQADADIEGATPFAFLADIDPEAPQSATMLRVILTPQRFFEIISTAYYDPTLTTDETVAGYTRPLLIENWTVGFLSYIQAEEQNPITLPELADAITNTPTLIIWGEVDTWVPIAVGETMHETLSNSTMITFPQVGHLPMEEAVDEFNAAVITFLDGQ